MDLLNSWKKRLLVVFLCACLVLAVCAGALLYKRKSIEEGARTYIIGLIDQATGGKSSIHSLQLRLFPMQLTIRRLTIQKSGVHPSVPVLFIKEVRLRPRWRSLFHKIHFKSVELEEPQVIVLVGAQGETNVPAPVFSANDIDLFRVSIDRLRINRGLLQLDDRQAHLETEVNNFILQARHQASPESYQVNLEYETAGIRQGRFTWNHNLNVVAAILRNEIRIERLVTVIDQSRLEAQGFIRNFKDPDGILNFHGALAVNDLRQFYPEIRELAGEVGHSGQLILGPAGWKVQGGLSGTNLRFGPARINHASCQYRISPQKIEIEQMKITGLSGRSEGTIVIDSPFRARHFGADLHFEDFSLMDLFAVARFQNIPLNGLLSGVLKASWEDHWKGFAGDGRLQIAESRGGGTIVSSKPGVLPVSGQLNFVLTRWSSSFENSHLIIGGNRLDFSGTLSPDRISELHLEVKSPDLSTLAFLAPGLQGQMRFAGTAEGSLRMPRLLGTLEASDIRYQRFVIDHLSGQLRASPDSVDLVEIVVTRRDSRVVVQGKIPLDPSRLIPAGSANLRFRLREAGAEGLMEMVGKKVPASGLLSGDFMASGELSSLTLQGVAQVRQGCVSNQPFDFARFEMEYRQPILTVSSLSAQLGSGQLKGSAQLDFSRQEVHTNLAASNIPLSRIRILPQNMTLNGLLRELVLKANGPFRTPALEGQVEIKSLEISGMLAGDLQTSFATRNETVQFNSKSVTSGGRLQASGSVRLDEEYTLNSKLDFENFSFAPYLKQFLPTAPEALTSQASGELTVTGSLLLPDQLKLAGTLTSMKIDFRETSLQASRPFSLQIQDGQLEIHNAAFSGKGTSLSVEGSIHNLRGDKKVDLTLGGSFDLALINEFARKITAKGSGTVNAVARGTLSDPRMKGYADINAEFLTFQDFPNSLSQVTGRLFFDENQINLSGLTGSSGGGKIRMSGNLVFAQATAKLINLNIEAREVRIRYPEGMRNVIDADLNLRGSQQSQLLDGNIRILSASFQKDYDPISEFIASRNSRISLPGGKELGNSLNLDLSITGDRSIRLDTSLARITSRADLKVKGTPANPLLTGSIEASGGEIYFQGARYRITRGRIDFANPTRIDPRLDLEAETDVRDYRIVLSISGTADKFRADLRSDPPLSTMELFSLVSAGGTGAGGVTTVSPRPFSVAGRQQQDASLGATSLLSEGLSLKMGSRVKQIFGLDRFRVEPPAFLLGNSRDPAARVTFGQQVTRDLSVTYSTSVSTNEQQVILVEYGINDSTSIIASRDSEGAFGLDVRFRKRLRQGNQ